MATPDRNHVTLPAEAGEEALVEQLATLWKADAVRDSDGTELSAGLLDLGLEVYSTLCLVRDDQTWPREHPEQLPQKYLLSSPATAQSETLTIDLLEGYSREKYVVDAQHDEHRYWEVIDRTTGEVLPDERWSLDKDTGTVTLTGITPFHVYTVGFLVWIVWDTTSMYNHIVNGWTKPHVIGVDPYHQETWDHLMGYFDAYLEGHPKTDVVRLTTLAYHFTVDSDEAGADLFRDWTGYQDTVSVPALEDFATEHGYRLRAEDFLDEGYHNAANRVPSERWLAWMAFIHRFVVRFGRELVRRANAAGKRTAIFWGDHWAGVEPHLPSFQEMGIDIHIGAAEDGVALRRVSDAPGPQVKELRLYPYFFPDVFRPDGSGDPVTESQSNWVKIRRAMLRVPVDRLGYGGYLTLATAYPDFVEHVTGLLEEFRQIRETSEQGRSTLQPLTVAVVNAWGAWKPWINSFGAEQKFLDKRPDVIQVAGTNLLECLAGLPVDVRFLSLSDIATTGIPEDVDVIINDGDAETAWSGGRWWSDPRVVTAIRAFVSRGGGFIGSRGPTAFPHQGRYFQLADVLGVDKEVGQTLQQSPAGLNRVPEHFITADLRGHLDIGNPETFVFPLRTGTDVLAWHGNHVHVATHGFGKGRSVFLAQLPWSLHNARLLYRAISWAAHREQEWDAWATTNPLTDCARYPAAGRMAVVNNVDTPQSTTVCMGDGPKRELELAPYELRWLKIEDNR